MAENLQCIRHGGRRNTWSCVAAVLILCCGRHAAAGVPTNGYGQHAFFDNGSADEFYYHSVASCVAPSVLDVSGGKMPLDRDHFHSPPNCLRLKWKSAPGGDWRISLKSAAAFMRPLPLKGDTLSLWCYSVEGLSEEESPRISLQESRQGTPTISLLANRESLPSGKWVEVRLPLEKFHVLYQGTDEERFNLSRLREVTLVQNLEDNRKHTLFIDDVSVVEGTVGAPQPLAAPTQLAAEGYDRHTDLSWAPVENPSLLSYRIYRSADRQKYEPIATRPGWSCRYEDFLGGPGITAHYKVSAIDVGQNESPLSQAISAATRSCSDDELLDMVQRGCFRYYWDVANPDCGMAIEVLPGDPNLVAMGASGFGVMAQLVATERKFITREDSVSRMLKIVRFLAKADRFHGVWPHFLDGRTGRVNPYFGKYDNGGDLVETAFMMQGLLAARQYFNQDTAAEKEIRDTITSFWQEVEWDWYRKSPDSDFLYWHWSPDHAWHISHPLIGWNETLIVYLLAIASPTHAVPASMYYSGWAGQSQQAIEYRRGWSRTTAGDHFANGNSYYGIKLEVGSGTGAELFFTQFSFLGFDPRGKRDRFTNYSLNNRNIALIDRAYCAENPRKYAGYGADCWGLSAGVHSGGGRPLPRDDNGTICSSAALGVFPYTPAESMAALKHFYRDLGPKIWGAYGFHDGFNATEKWYDEIYMGLNQAQIVVGIENHRTALVWQNFMKNQEIGTMLKAVGFTEDAPENEEVHSPANSH
jgi:hypothetical protein